MPYVIVEGWDYFYHDSFQQNPGSAPCVILIHCSNASHKEWLPLISQLEPRFRAIAPDLAGYGKSGRWPEDRPYDPIIDRRMIEALARLHDGPVHLAGHSFGAAVALEFARHAGDQVKSLVVIEPPLFFLLDPAGYGAEWEEVRRVTEKVLAAMAAGNPRKAASAYMSFWLGPIRWWLTPRKVKAAIFETMTKTAKEFEFVEVAALRAERSRAITAPTRLICGSKTPRQAKAITSILAKDIPNAHVCEIRGAGHMSPFTHAEEVNRLILEHIEANL